MPETLAERILRLPDVIAAYGKSRSSVYSDIARGVMTPPVGLGGRSAGWPASEVNAIIRARIASKSDDEIRALVRELVSRRSVAA